MLTPSAPYRFKRLTPQDVVRRNRIYKKDPGLSFQLGSHTYALKVEPGDMGPPLTASYRAMVRIDERNCFELFPEDKLLALMLTDIVSVEAFDNLPPEIRGIALEAALENFLEQIEHFSGAKATIASVDGPNEADPSKSNIGFTLTRPEDGVQCRGAIQTDETGFEWLTARLSRLPGKRFRQFKNLPLFGCIEIGRTDLTFAELMDLAPLDLLLCGSSGTWGERDIRIRYGNHLTLSGRLNATDRVLIQNIMIKNGARSSMPEAESATTTQVQEAIAGIPVTLVFEIGQTQMALGEFAQLQPGYIFQPSEPLEINRPVTIRANGVAVGSGDIVQIGDTLGIRIQHFSADTTMASE